MAEFDIVDLSEADAELETLTPQQHLAKADAAWAAARKLRSEMDEREVADGRSRAKASDWYLTREHDFLTLCQIVNLHANMATAKSNVAIMEGLGW